MSLSAISGMHMTECVYVVTACMGSVGRTQLVDLAIDTGQARNTKNGHIAAAEGDPFRAPELRHWVDAADLELGGLLDRAVRTVGKRGHIGRAETMCLVLAERAEGESALLNGVTEAVRVRGLKSGGTAHGSPAHPCVGTCQSRLDRLGIDHIG
ncbi:hypothetical protein [Streptomyces sp. NBC_01767]|uniref:hypothetical protein n=1 Tax=Streptomyces sp. NBC_01767 TaxID=2975937 RepID=UPI002254F962|nr:hypothetical protein [Streptomyces sp. NBC_01767]MCX4393934.1 hypothetical protein [Streptomyces sp. NBC_01767]